MSVNQDKKLERVIAISGFGAYQILYPENGLHVMEVPGKGRSFQRYTTRVNVLPQPVEEGPLLQQAENVYSQVDTNTPEIVRRYREQPSPLVRDTIRKWRTGRIDLIWKGNFDIIH
jgi:ATP-dependent Clp protease ATP-binding subunit ClpC